MLNLERLLREPDAVDELIRVATRKGERSRLFEPACHNDLLTRLFLESSTSREEMTELAMFRFPITNSFETENSQLSKLIVVAYTPEKWTFNGLVVEHIREKLPLLYEICYCKSQPPKYCPKCHGLNKFFRPSSSSLVSAMRYLTAQKIIRLECKPASRTYARFKNDDRMWWYVKRIMPRTASRKGSIETETGSKG